MKRRMILALLALAVVPLGCQALWASVTSPSDWVAGSSDSISGSIRGLSRSSGSGGGTKSSLAYRRDVRAWAATFAQTGGTQDEFLHGIGRIAESHGLTHWEADPATLVAIGEGLHDAGWSVGQMDGLRADLADVEAERVDAVFEGYRGAGG